MVEACHETAVYCFVQNCVALPAGRAAADRHIAVAKYERHKRRWQAFLRWRFFLWRWRFGLQALRVVTLGSCDCGHNYESPTPTNSTAIEATAQGADTCRGRSFGLWHGSSTLPAPLPIASSRFRIRR